MTTHHTIDEAFENLIYSTKIIRLKQKLVADYLSHDKQLDYMLKNVEDSSIHKLIDKSIARFGEDFFDEDEV